MADTFGMTFKTFRAGFFDRGPVMRAVDRATRRVLSRFGAFVRQRAKTSIRQRQGTSPVGSPPYSHVGTLRRLILFAFDPSRRSVVIGPVPIGRRSHAPHVLEYGGLASVATRRGVQTWRYGPRPFMGPAFEQEKPQLPSLWRDSVR